MTIRLPDGQVISSVNSHGVNECGVTGERTFEVTEKIKEYSNEYPLILCLCNENQTALKHYQIRRICISSILKKLHIIKTKSCISSLRKVMHLR